MRSWCESPDGERDMKIICIGRNYGEHAKELNNAIPAEPVFFIKPDSALLLHNEPFLMPDFSKEIHHEVGAPPGVGPVKSGDRLTGRLEGMQMFEFDVK